MKKILCVIIVVLMFNVFTIPAMALTHNEILSDIHNNGPTGLIGTKPNFDTLYSHKDEQTEENDQDKQNEQTEEINRREEMQKKALEFADSHTGSERISGKHENLTIGKNNIIIEGATATVTNKITFAANSDLYIYGVLTGTIISLEYDHDFPPLITMGKNGYIDLTCSDNSIADELYSLLEIYSDNYSLKREGNHIAAGNFPPCVFGHTWDSDGKCSVCSEECMHEWLNGKYVCPDCGMSFDATVTASVLSEGNIWIIVGVAVVALGAVAALVIVKKKKKTALAGGTNHTDEE